LKPAKLRRIMAVCPSEARAMRRVAVIGAGKIGATVVDLLAGCGSFEVLAIDAAAAALNGLDPPAPIERRVMAIDAADTLAAALAGCFAVVNCAPFATTTIVAQAARQAQVHYLDLTEDVAAARIVRELAQGADSAFLSQCGLAPGFVSIAAWELARDFETLHDVRLRVGALPRYPSNALNYNLTWCTDGLINEYCEPCEAIVDGRRRELPALEAREEFALDGVVYEAFNTSGGLGTLGQTLEGRVRNLNYKTIRYPGHAAIMSALINDLGLRRRRDLLKEILENGLPATLQDVVLIFVTVSGLKGGRLMQETYVNRVFGQPIAGRMRCAIQAATAGAVCAVLDLLAEGRLPQRGFVPQEDIPLADMLANRFGRVFAPEPPSGWRAAA
jgi:saccharopine dehydrogenase-like NADP-dependent oxidoreductase